MAMVYDHRCVVDGGSGKSWRQMANGGEVLWNVVIKEVVDRSE